VTGFWIDLPAGRVTRLCGASPEAIALTLDPLRDSMPAIVTYYSDGESSLSEAVGSVLDKLEQVAVGLWPAWLPGAEQLDGTGSAVIAAARALAAEMAVATGHFGPFLADLAERCISGAESGAIAVYRTVDWMLRCPRYACKERVSLPWLAYTKPQECLSM